MTGRAPLMIGIVAAAASILLGMLAGSDTAAARTLLLLGIGGAVGLTAAVVTPNSIRSGLGFVLGGVPFAVLPGAGPAALVMAAAAGVAALLHPSRPTRPHTIEYLVVLLVAVSAATIPQTATSPVHVTEFVKWAVATGLILVLLRMSPASMSRVQTAYVVGATVGGGFSLILLLVDRTGDAIGSLAVIGYGRTGITGTTLRLAEVDGMEMARLAGTYVHPNYAGIFLLVGLALAIARTSGLLRAAATPVIALATIATLSRAAIATVVVAAVLFLVLQTMTRRARLVLACTGGAAAVALASAPTVSARLWASFGQNDVGSSDRARALANFVPSMEGRWWFGRGWGAVELLDEVAGYNANYVANTPLLTIYRGGILVGLVFAALLVAGCVISYRRLRTPDWTAGVLGATFLAMVLIALQLDFPVVTSPPVTMAFGLLLAAVVASPTSPPAVLPDSVRDPVTEGAR